MLFKIEVMKQILYVFLGLLALSGSAQNREEAKVIQAVDNFFKAFHAKDSMALKKVVHTEAVLQTIGKTMEGNEHLKNKKFNDFIKVIASIPDSVNFQERLMDYSIQIDLPMANAWTTYEFWLNGTFHHCGVNSFQLLKEGTSWKIIYLVDTRRKLDCSNETEE